MWILNFLFCFLPASSGHFVVPYFFQLFSLHGFSISVSHPGTFLSILQHVFVQMVCYWFDCGLVISQCETLVESFPCIYFHGIVFIPVTKSRSASFLICENWYSWHFSSGVQRTVSSTKSTALTFLPLSNCVSKSSIVTLKKVVLVPAAPQDSPLLICILKACFQILLPKSIE